MKMLHMVVFILVIVGAVNVGLTALGYNVVEMLFSSVPGLEKLVDILIGASGVYLAATHMQDCKVCSKK